MKRIVQFISRALCALFTGHHWVTGWTVPPWHELGMGAYRTRTGLSGAHPRIHASSQQGRVWQCKGCGALYVEPPRPRAGRKVRA